MEKEDQQSVSLSHHNDLYSTLNTGCSDVYSELFAQGQLDPVESVNICLIKIVFVQDQRGRLILECSKPVTPNEDCLCRVKWNL